MKLKSRNLNVILYINFFASTSNNENALNCLLYFCIDDRVSHPKYCKTSSDSHNISDWNIPCCIQPINNDQHNQCEYLLTHNRYAYLLAQRNDEFKTFLIKNALEALCKENQYEMIKSDYRIINDDINAPIKPRYEISIRTSNNYCDDTKFVQLIVWLPGILSHHPIVLEASSDTLYLRTDEDNKYELELPWPPARINSNYSSTKSSTENISDRTWHISETLTSFFASKLILVSHLIGEQNKMAPQLELENQEAASDEHHISTDEQNTGIDKHKKKQKHNKKNKKLKQDEPPTVFVPPNIDTIGDDDCFYDVYNSAEEDTETFSVKSILRNKNRLYSFYDSKSKHGSASASQRHCISFSDYNRCLAYCGAESVADLVTARSECQIPTKTQDGTSSQKYTSAINSRKINSKNCKRNSGKNKSKKKK